MMKTYRYSGFTLLELLVVIGMIIIVTGVTAPRVISGFRYGELKGAADQLLTTARYAQGMAAIQRATYSLTVDLTKNSFYISRSAQKNKDFTLSDNDFIAGESSLFPGQKINSMPDDWNDDVVDPFYSTSESSTNETSGRIAIFDDEAEYVCGYGVVIDKVEDGRGRTITEGKHTVPFTPHGTAQETTIYFTLRSKNTAKYIVHIAHNGSTRMYREDENE